MNIENRPSMEDMGLSPEGKEKNIDKLHASWYERNHQLIEQTRAEKSPLANLLMDRPDVLDAITKSKWLQARLGKGGNEQHIGIN